MPLSQAPSSGPARARTDQARSLRLGRRVPGLNRSFFSFPHFSCSAGAAVEAGRQRGRGEPGGGRGPEREATRGGERGRAGDAPLALALKTENKQRPRAAASCLPDCAGTWPGHTYRSAATRRPWPPVHSAALLCALFPPEERSEPLAFKTPARVLIGGPAQGRPRGSSFSFVLELDSEPENPRRGASGVD